MERPAISTINRSPGGIASTGAAVYLPMSLQYPALRSCVSRRGSIAAVARSKAVERARVPGHELPFQVGRQADGERRVWRVEIPVRVVGGEHDLVVHVQVPQELGEVAPLRRL